MVPSPQIPSPLNPFRRAGLIAAILTISVLPCLVADNIPAAPVTATTTTLSSAVMMEDFDFMRAALEEAHAGLHRYATKAGMDRSFAAQRARLVRPMTKREFYEVMSETVVEIRCGHTSINPDDEMRNAFDTARLFPLQVLLEGRRVVVRSNNTPDDQTIRPGMEVLEINGHKVTDLLSRFWRVDSADGDIETSKRVHIQSGFAMYYWLLIEETDRFTVRARDAAGATVDATLPGVTKDKLGKSQNAANAAMKEGQTKMDWPGGNLSLRFLKDPDVAQIRIRLFAGNTFPQWMEDTFKTLREKGTKSLIIDLRGNGGGADMYGALLVSYLTDKPFRYFDHINAKTIDPTFKAHADWSAERTSKLRKEVTANPAGGWFVQHKGVEEQPPGKFPFLGKVFVLIDGGVFSTAADFCAVTHHLKRAIFIGEETGGGYYGNNSGSFARVKLPKSGFQVRIPMYEYWNAVPEGEGKRRGTIPDHVVETKVANLLQGVDDQLNLALKLALQIPRQE